MGKRGRILLTKVKFARDRKHPEKQIDKSRKKYGNTGLNSNSPSNQFGQIKKPSQKGTKGNR